MSGRSFDLSDVEELTGVLEQRERLEAILNFLQEHGADAEILGVIDEPVDDL